jgi:protein-S-isoprenylcysteine O-methyltransferase Ste14
LSTFLRTAIPALWVVWLVVWVAAAPFAKPAQWREAGRARLLDAVPLLLCVLLLIPRARWLWPGPLLARFAPPGAVLPLLGTALVAAGLVIAVWARVHLGRNWSRQVVVKQNHALIRSGPYAVVRHPIYTGVLLGLLGTALAIGEWRGLLALVCGALAFLRRIVVEEQRMRETFAEYETYRRTTWALLPGLF